MVNLVQVRAPAHRPGGSRVVPVNLVRFAGSIVRQGVPASLEAVTRLFIDAICDTIEAKGAGAWHLLDAKTQDPDVAQLGREIQARLMAPWHAHIAAVTRAPPRDVQTVTLVLVAAGRAVLEQWYAGSLTRTAAARAASRSVSALLAAFTVDAPTKRAKRAR